MNKNKNKRRGDEEDTMRLVLGMNEFGGICTLVYLCTSLYIHTYIFSIDNLDCIYFFRYNLGCHNLFLNIAIRYLQGKVT